ncbi:MAG TPA: OmpA family protein [Candidatus Kapabacteria bacterium]|nr:OmpA family protein [Candidatus Kapabacteria bacterium]
MFEEALYEYGEAIKLDSNYPYPWSRVAGMYQTLKNHKLAVQYYHRAIRIDSNFDAYNYYNLGTSLRVLQKPDSAAFAFTQFVKRMVPFTSFDTVQMQEADFWIKFNLESQAERLKKPSGDAPINVPGLNSDYDDYGVSMTADGENMYFTSRRPASNIKQYYETKDYGDDLFLSSQDSIGNWRKPNSLDPPLNQVDEDGSAFISADGLTMFTTLCRRPEGVGDCDIYISESTVDGWTMPQNLGRVVNSPAWDGQPSMTADGSTMYFSSSRQGSIGNSEDLYVVYRGSGGSWTRPLNLGDVVNTRFNDRSPFISADGKTLYFSSNGHPGYGNHDIFMTRKLDDGTWSKPVNIGAPINSFGEDAYLSIPARGDTVYYSSQRDDASNDLDIYKSKLPTEFRPGPVTVIAGRVIDKVTTKPVAASINVTDLAGDELVAVYRANPVTGKFFITLGTGKHYGITANAPGYVFYSENYTVPDTIPYREIVHDLPLTPLGNLATNDPVKDPKNPNKPPVKDPKDPKKPPTKPEDPNKGTGKPPKDAVVIDTPKKDPNVEQPRTIIALNNIFFDFNKATLRKESITELKNLVKLLKDNPKLRIEIAGHTDSIGTADINERLSQMRAEAVKQYLVDWGITSTRLRAKGYGSTRPVATNETEEGRQQNRRTEFEILNATQPK